MSREKKDRKTDGKRGRKMGTVAAGPTAEEKLEELILYISDYCKDDDSFGVTKLNKVLFLSDIIYYGITGSPITGTSYMHEKRGPVARKFVPAIESLKKDVRIKEEKREYFGKHLRKILPLKGVNASLFKTEELNLVNVIIEEIKAFSASHISTGTHDFNAWLITENGEEIPYHSIFMLKKVPVDQESMNWAKKELRRLRLVKDAA
jgi:Antitoxin SocA-like, Panacea domain